MLKREPVVRRRRVAQRVRLRLKANLDLFCCGLLALIVLLFVFVLPTVLHPLRSVFSFVFLLLAPGYLAAAVLFPRENDIDGVERLALSVGLSIAAVPFVGLLLNATPWGIRLPSMSLGLAVFAWLMAFAALERRRRVAPGARFYSAHSAPTFRQNLFLLGMVVLVGTVVVVTAQTLRPSQAVTEFYLLGSSGRLQDLPSELRPGQAFTVTLGVRHFGKRETYRIHAPFAGNLGDVVLPPLGDGEVWQRELTLRAPTAMGQRALSFELYQSGASDPFRTLRHYVSLDASSRRSVALCPGGQLC